jgi:hypothetical protein
MSDLAEASRGVDASGALIGPPVPTLRVLMVKAWMGGLVGLLVAALLIEALTGDVPNEHLAWFHAGGVIGGLLGTLFPVTPAWRRASRAGGLLILARRKEETQVPLDSVEVLLATAAISLSGGPLLIWKYIDVISGGHRYRFRPHNPQLAWDYLLEWCPWASAVDRQGYVILPKRLGTAAGQVSIEQSSTSCDRAMGTQVGRASLLAMVCLLGSASLAVAAVSAPLDVVGQAWMLVAIGAVTGTMLGLQALRLQRVRRVARMLWATVPLSAQAAGDQPRRYLVEPERQQGPATGVVVLCVLLVATVLTFWLPLFGCILAALAFRAARGRSGGTRALARALLIASGTISAAVLIVLAVLWAA